MFTTIFFHAICIAGAANLARAAFKLVELIEKDQTHKPF